MTKQKSSRRPCLRWTPEEAKLVRDAVIAHHPDRLWLDSIDRLHKNWLRHRTYDSIRCQFQRERKKFTPAVPHA